MWGLALELAKKAPGLSNMVIEYFNPKTVVYILRVVLLGQIQHEILELQAPVALKYLGEHCGYCYALRHGSRRPRGMIMSDFSCLCF